jgi:hypothetical protein
LINPKKVASIGITDFKIGAPSVVPEGGINSEEQAFRIGTVIAGLDPLPYSIALLPGWRIRTNPPHERRRLRSQSQSFSRCSERPQDEKRIPSFR